MPEKYKRSPNCGCAICAKPMYRRPSIIAKGNVFCSMPCYRVSARKESPCIVCGEMILASKKAKTCSRACANKRRTGIKYKSGNLGNKASANSKMRDMLVQLRGCACERCGYDNKNVLQCHHIIERAKGGSNDPGNLELLCPNCHYTHHLGDSRTVTGD